MESTSRISIKQHLAGYFLLENHNEVLTLEKLIQYYMSKTGKKIWLWTNVLKNADHINLMINISFDCSGYQLLLH